VRCCWLCWDQCTYQKVHVYVTYPWPNFLHKVIYVTWYFHVIQWRCFVLNEHKILIKDHAKKIAFNPLFEIMIFLLWLRTFSILKNVIIILKLLSIVFSTQKIAKICLRQYFWIALKDQHPMVRIFKWIVAIMHRFQKAFLFNENLTIFYQVLLWFMKVKMKDSLFLKQPI
jgi:hypothetical protein